MAQMVEAGSIFLILSASRSDAVEGRAARIAADVPGASLPPT